MSNLIRDNIVKDAATGELFIPASKRPDGTWRKAVRVKKDYIPPDEVPLYESKATQLAKNKETVKKVIPGAVFVDDQTKKPKNKPEGEDATTSVTKKMNEIKISNKITPEQIEADLKQKQVRKLRKQLREIEQLEEKISSGQLSAPEKEQLEKISKKDLLIEQINELGESVDL